MDDIVLKTVLGHNLLKNGDKVLVALSGGADSVVLLHVLLQLKQQIALTVEALHVNHGIRGKNADKDQQFCQQLCAKLDIPLHSAHCDVPKLARQKGLGIEECARIVRYDYFERMRIKRQFDVVATAHNRDDNAETVLYHMIRGSGLKGLCGIPYQRQAIIRPLLDCTKQQVLEYAKKNHIDYVFDETNDDILYTRNFIRHKIMPNALKINPGFLQSCAMMGKTLSIDEQYLEQKADAVYQKGRQGENFIVFLKSNFEDLHDAIASRVVMRAYRQISGKKQLSATHVLQSVQAIKNQKQNKSIVMPAQIWMELCYDKIIFRKMQDGGVGQLYYPLQSDGGSVYIAPLGVTLTYQVECTDQKNVKNHGIFYINYDIINDNIFLRNRKEKDAFIPLGGVGKRSLKKMLIDAKIPKYQRDFLPVLCCGEHVIWAYGLSRINDEYKVQPETKKVLKLEIKEENGLA